MPVKQYTANAINVAQSAPQEFVVTFGCSDRTTFKVIIGMAQAASLVVGIQKSLPEEEPFA